MKNRGPLPQRHPDSNLNHEPAHEVKTMHTERKTDRGGSEALRGYLRAHGDPGLTLSRGARSRILAEAVRPAAGLAPFGLHRLPGLSLAAAAVALLILSAGFLARVPGNVGAGAPGAARAAVTPDGPSGLAIDYENGQVTLTWNGAKNGAYEVRRAAKLPEARVAPGEKVRGTTFTDVAVPAPSQAVFYVVE